MAAHFSGFVRTILAWFIGAVFGDDIFANILRVSRRKGVDEYWKSTAEAREYNRMFNKEVGHVVIW